MKKLFALFLAVTMLFSVASCGKNDETVSKMLTLYNNTDYILNTIVMAPSESLLDSEDAIVLFDEASPLSTAASTEVTVEFPAELYKENWVIRVVGTDLNEMLRYYNVYDLGDIFNVSDEEYSKEVWGFEIRYDYEEEMFFIVKLDGTKI